MTEQTKSLANQVSEITKLVSDVQDRLDQVLRALSTLQDRVAKSDGR
jgi:peptidoglycan hydrolase CwlO-like protein